jgi:hypothetical protein
MTTAPDFIGWLAGMFRRNKKTIISSIDFAKMFKHMNPSRSNEKGNCKEKNDY